MSHPTHEEHWAGEVARAKIAKANAWKRLKSLRARAKASRWDGMLRLEIIKASGHHADMVLYEAQCKSEWAKHKRPKVTRGES